MDIKEIKIVLDWAESKVNDYTGSQLTMPERYTKSLQTLEKVKSKFDEECEKWVMNNCYYK